VVQDPADHVLGDVLVDQPGAQGVAELMGCQVGRSAEFVAGVTARQPLGLGAPIGGGVERLVAVQVGAGTGEEDRAAVWPLACEPLLLVADVLVEFLVDGHQRLTLHLVVEIPQVGSAVGIADDGVERQVEGVEEPKAAAHEDDGDQPSCRIVPAVEGGGIFQLGHDVLGDCPGQQRLGLGEVLGNEGRAGW